MMNLLDSWNSYLLISFYNSPCNFFLKIHSGWNVCPKFMLFLGLNFGILQNCSHQWNTCFFLKDEISQNCLMFLSPSTISIVYFKFHIDQYHFYKLKMLLKHYYHLSFCSYQLELCKKALEENIIVYLGTGCGKTHIAILLIYEMRHLIRRSQKGICVFLAPTVALVQQVLKLEIIEKLSGFYLIFIFIIIFYGNKLYILLSLLCWTFA